MKRALSNIGFAVIVAVLVLVNVYYFSRKNADTLFGRFELAKPSLVLLMGEHECMSCVLKVASWTDIYDEVRSHESFGLYGFVLSEGGKDPKRISDHFDFPVVGIDDFGVLARLNLDETPILMVVDQRNRILYSELILEDADIDLASLKDTVIQKLYYALYE